MTKWSGVPEDSDWDGWHWVSGIPRYWDADRQEWEPYKGSFCPPNMFPKYYGDYEGPCLTPMEVAALVEKTKKEAST